MGELLKASEQAFFFFKKGRKTRFRLDGKGEAVAAAVQVRGKVLGCHGVGGNWW